MAGRRLHAEPGAELVEVAVTLGTISTVNWSEVHQRSLARGIDTAELRSEMQGLGLEIVPFSADDAEQAAAFSRPTRTPGLSLGDRACLALARRLACPALTADRAWLTLDLDVEVKSIAESSPASAPPLPSRRCGRT
jgi:PIN domain nuclease of toxin-antitoxin system